MYEHCSVVNEQPYCDRILLYIIPMNVYCRLEGGDPDLVYNGNEASTIIWVRGANRLAI
jgi:hypothetical protein